ncbi:MAG: hypothetical protein ACREJQ_04240, partial [bacterium]
MSIQPADNRFLPGTRIDWKITGCPPDAPVVLEKQSGPYLAPGENYRRIYAGPLSRLKGSPGEGGAYRLKGAASTCAFEKRFI